MEVKKPWQLSSIREEVGVEGAEDEELELFYEEIEAPKFVDLTLPDPFRKGDDRYWFCQRVGCDQKHDEEMDPEEIYKNFVLRVMAARSPNLKLRRALNKQTISGGKKSPASAPPKPSQSRLPRLAVVSVFSLKKTEPHETVRPQSKAISTPKARVRHVAAKYMTTPRGRRCSSNAKPFQSVRNPERNTLMQKNDKVVAKALVFDSPQKSRKIKASEECYTPITRLCTKLKKLEITSQKKSNIDKVSKDMAVNDAKLSSAVAVTRPTRVQKVETQNSDYGDGKKHETSTCRSINGGTEVGSFRQNHQMSHGETADYSLSEITNGSPDDSQQKGDQNSIDEEDSTVSESLRNITLIDSQEEATSATACPPKFEDYSARSSGDGESQSDSNSTEKIAPAGTLSDSQGIVGEGKSCSDAEGVGNVESDSSKKERPSPLDHCSPEHQSSGEGLEGECVDISNKENAPTSKIIRKHPVKDISRKQQDKENDPASNVTRNLNIIRHEIRKDTSSKHDKTRRMKIIQTTGMMLKENSSSDVRNQASTHKKLKVTNPKPFRLRTDERSILKEATLERRHKLYEARTASDLSSETSQRDNWNNNTQLNTGTKQQKDPKQEADTKSGTLKPKKQMISAQQKPITVPSELKHKKEKDVLHALEQKSTMTRSSLLQKEPVVRPLRCGQSSKATGGLRHCGSNPTGKASKGHWSASKVRRPPTFPKEPNF